MAKRTASKKKASNAPKSTHKGHSTTAKVDALKAFTVDPDDTALTTNQGTAINDDQNSLKAGERGSTLLEDFILREKITHFDHERIPERIVHARGAGAHGVFQVYESMAPYTRAQFLQDPSVKTPVFVRFSTVAGSRGSTDLARDVRGFAVKFYTPEGVFDLVGNNIPVFFIQDAMKFPDLVHAVKPEPHNEIPQAASAHDTFWDFISLMPESMHMIMWVMSDRAIPRSFRMMEGFGVHTFRLVNDKGRARFVKFHWKPLLGVHSVAWDEAQKISGADPDFHRRDLWEAIETGNFPEYEFGVQIVEEKDEDKLGFDLLDPTKLIPEELVPVRRIGKLTLNRNPENFFAETEQVAFHPGHIVPGIDFTEDPLLQGRLFSYTDTQLLRLGGPNFHEIPINRSLAPVSNHQRDGFMRQAINTGRVSYEPNSLGGGCPYQAGAANGGFVTHAAPIDGAKVRARSRTFFDHFSQATLFFNSQSPAEKHHLIRALRFELGKVEVPPIRERMLYLLSQVSGDLARQVADHLGIAVPSRIDGPINRSVPADGNPKDFQPTKNAGVSGFNRTIETSAALSMDATVKDTVKTRKVAILAANGFDDAALATVKKALTSAGAMVKVVAPTLGAIVGSGGSKLQPDFSLLTTASVLFDAVYVAGGRKSADTLAGDADAVRFVNEAYKHCKAIAATGAGRDMVRQSAAATALETGDDAALVAGSDQQASQVAKAFIAAVAQHRNWDRETHLAVPA
jgi:catalase